MGYPEGSLPRHRDLRTRRLKQTGRQEARDGCIRHHLGVVCFGARRWKYNI